jgi:hypothetical protein
MELVAVVTMFVLIEVAALLGGRDSRDGNDWARHPRV